MKKELKRRDKGKALVEPWVNLFKKKIFVVNDMTLNYIALVIVNK